MKCYVCGEDAIKRHNRSNMCAKHHRFYQMQTTAKRDKKYVPSIYEIEGLVPKDMVCQDCGTTMNWIDGERAEGAVLQHYRDGSLGIVCLSCNTRHGFMPGDSYKELPEGHKLCTGCKTIKPLNEFGKRGKAEGNYPKSKCKVCDHESQKLWRQKNPEGYKKLNKRNNDKKKLDPEKYRALDRKYYHSKKDKDAKLTSSL